MNRGHAGMVNPAETLLINGTILTMDTSRPRAEALLWRDNRIVAVGTRQEVLNAVVGDSPETIDLAGRTVIPGFNDAHIHLLFMGDREASLNLEGLSKAEILKQVSREAARLQPGKLLLGYHWDYPECPDPHISDLDAIAPDRPVALFQFSGHGAWVNSKGLELFGITRDGAEWPMGGADRDGDGNFTGIVRELWQAPGANKILIKGLLQTDKIRAAIPRALERLKELGITSVQDNTWFPKVLNEYRRLYRSGNLTCRIACWSPGFIKPVDFLFSLKRFNAAWYARGPRKYFLDGAFSSHTAWLSEPYADQPDTSGSGVPPEKFARIIERANRQGRQIACHSIGDAATHSYLDAVELSGREEARRLRHRIEHGQLILEDDVDRIANHGMVVSAQPHAANTPEKDLRLLGPERADRAYPYRALLDAGVHLAFGSDYPGESTIDPLHGIHLTVNRTGGQAITVEEALYCYTAGGAYAQFQEHEKGLLKEGFLCDLAVLSEDPTAVAKERVGEIRVDATIVDGQVVFERAGAELPQGADAVPTMPAETGTGR